MTSLSIGVGMAKHEFQLGAGVGCQLCRPSNVVYSYTEDPNFKDCFYWGEVKTVQVNELKKINPSLTNQDLVEISQYGRSWYNQYQRNDVYQNDMFSDDVCTLLYFNYKTTKAITYKKKLSEDGTVRFIEKDDTFNPPQEMMDEAGFERVSKTIDVWYEA